MPSDVLGIHKLVCRGALEFFSIPEIKPEGFMRACYCLLLASVAACGSSATSYSSGNPPPPPPPPTGSSANVTIQDFAYSATSLSVSAGTTVRWTNDGPSSHTVTSDTPGQFASGTLSGPVPDGYGGMTSGASYTHTFATQGSFAYHCALHAQMTGTVVVTP